MLRTTPDEVVSACHTFITLTRHFVEDKLREIDPVRLARGRSQYVEDVIIEACNRQIYTDINMNDKFDSSNPLEKEVESDIEMIDAFASLFRPNRRLRWISIRTPCTPTVNALWI